jgi:hypothetical protein
MRSSILKVNMKQTRASLGLAILLCLTVILCDVYLSPTVAFGAVQVFLGWLAIVFTGIVVIDAWRLDGPSGQLYFTVVLGLAAVTFHFLWSLWSEISEHGAGNW